MKNARSRHRKRWRGSLSMTHSHTTRYRFSISNRRRLRSNWPRNSSSRFCSIGWWYHTYHSGRCFSDNWTRESEWTRSLCGALRRSKRVRLQNHKVRYSACRANPRWRGLVRSSTHRNRRRKSLSSFATLPCKSHLRLKTRRSNLPKFLKSFRSGRTISFWSRRP